MSCKINGSTHFTVEVRQVVSGPLVRSSYHADMQFDGNARP